MKQKGYDGHNGLGLKKEGIMEPILASKQSHNTGLGYQPFVKAPSTTIFWEEVINVFEVVETSKDYHIETNSNEWEWGSDKSLSNYDLVETFQEPDQSSPQTNNHVQTNTFLDPNSSSVFTLSTSSINFVYTSNDMPLLYPQLIDWDQQGPLSLDLFKIDEAIAKFMGLRDRVPSGDHKDGFTIDLDTTAYYGDSTFPSSCKTKEVKKNKFVGENRKAPIDNKI